MTRATATPAADGATLTVHVPMSFRRRGGQKVVVVPGHAPQRSPRPRAESRPVKLLARAFFWKQLIETGEYATLADLASAEKVNKSYLSKVLRLALLAPDIVEAILDGEEDDDLRVEKLLLPFPAGWKRQRNLFLRLRS
jgi:hypothetical protein